MPEWLQQSVTLSSSLSIEQLAIRLLVATAFGAGVAGIYQLSHGRAKPESGAFIATLVLLSVLIAMVSLVIGESVARAFSLVGALSIVRFRTVVDDTRDTAFVIFAVIVGMAAGAGMVLVPLLGIPVVGAIAILLARWNRRSATARLAESALSIRLGLGRDPELMLDGILKRYVNHYRLTRVETAQKGTSLDLNYLVQLQPTSSLAALVTELNQVDGVQGVELRT